MSDATFWKNTPAFKKEGTFKGVVTKVDFVPGAGVARILFREEGSPEFVPNRPEHIPEDVYWFIHRDDYELVGSFKCDIYQGSNKNIANPDDPKCVSPFHFLLNYRDGSPVTIRTSYSWNGKRLYVRYLKNEETGMYFGTPEEADFRERAHPYSFFPFSGSCFVKILHVDPVMDEDGNRVYRVELTRPDDKLPYRYKAYIRMSSGAGRKIGDPISAAYFAGKELTAIFTHNPETGRTTLDDFPFGENEERKKKKKKEKKIYVKSFGDDKAIADKYPKLSSAEFEKTKGVYKAIVIEIPGIDYSRTHDYTGFLLDDGRTIVEEIKTAKAKYFTEISKEKNLIYDRRRLTTGTKVILYFLPARGRDYLILRCITEQNG